MQVIKYMFQPHGDERGMLVALEEYKDIPFEIKRTYYVYDVKKDAYIEGHAWRDLEQILICIHGNCKMLLDNGNEKKRVLLEKPYEGLYIANDVWYEMYDFSIDAVLLILTSQSYGESNQFQDYKIFMNEIVERKS